jgi:phosphoribosylamine---glycine ligase
VLAAAGYPDHPREGDAIAGLDTAIDGCKVFHAATALAGKNVVTCGGRVLCVTALGETVRQAQAAAYGAIAGIRFDGMQYRTDIGHRAIAVRKA